jgi:hypothetical protein
MVDDLSRFYLHLPAPEYFEENLDALLSEAVYRGANDWELERLMRDYERDHMTSNGLEHGAGEGSVGIPRLTLGDFRLTLDPGHFRNFKITKIVNAYKAQVGLEYRGLSATARAAFGSPGYYLYMRPLYYQYGYNTPFETIFSRIGPANFLEKKVVGGLHEKLRTRLPDVEKTLNEWSPGLASRVAKEITRIGGFVPRYIATKEGQTGPQKLSNHAFGLAVDIDSDWNPHIKDRSVIDVLTEITGFKYGEKFDPKASGDKVFIATQEWQKSREASDKLKIWLGKYLPIYEAQSNSSQQLDADEKLQLKRIGILVRFHGLNNVKEWKEHGIQSLPHELVAAMLKNGITWGEDYKGSKDSMHFELWPKDVLPPDSPHRYVQDLLNDPSASAMRAGQKKLRPSHR